MDRFNAISEPKREKQISLAVYVIQNENAGTESKLIKNESRRRIFI
jgi:hypothetical protein